MLLLTGLTALGLTRARAPRLAASAPTAASTAAPHAASIGSVEAHRYAVEYDDAERISVSNSGAERSSSKLVFRGTIGRAPIGGDRVQWWIEEATTLSLSYGEKPVPLDLGAARGRTITAVHDPNGRLAGFEASPEQEPTIEERVLRILVTDAQFTKLAADKLVVEEPSRHGRSVFEYVQAGGAARKTLQRYAAFDLHDKLHPKSHVTTDEHANATFEDVALRTLEASRTTTLRDDAGHELAALQMRLSLRDLGAAAVIPPRVALSAITPVHGPDVAQKPRSHAGGLTAQALAEQLTREGDAGRVSNHDRFLWQASALLREKPEAAEALRTPYLDPKARHERRALIADLLAGAGTPKSQATLCELLASHAADDDARKHLLNQRIGLIAAPTTATVDFARKSFLDSAHDGTHTGWAYSLGALARALSGSDPNASGSLNDALVSELRAATTPEQIAAALHALGNAGRVENVALIVPYAENPATIVRLAAADALRHTQTLESEGGLVALSTDAETQVAVRALEVLAGFTMREDLVSAARAAQKVEAPTEPVVRALIGLARSGLYTAPVATKALLEWLRPHARGESRAQVDGLLGLVS